MVALIPPDDTTDLSFVLMPPTRALCAVCLCLPCARQRHLNYVLSAHEKARIRLLHGTSRDGDGDDDVSLSPALALALAFHAPVEHCVVSCVLLGARATD